MSRKLLKKVELDEIELYLSVLSKEPDRLKDKTYAEIAIMIRREFGVWCTEQQVNLLYEPTIEEMSIDVEILYKGVLGL